VSLRGVTGQEGDKVALLNNRPCKAGDKVTLRLSGDLELNVTVLQVREDSVVFTVQGSSKEYEKRLSAFGLEPM